MNSFIEDFKGEFDASLDHLKQELKSLRIGRANSGMLDSVLVEAYGTKMPLNQLAGINSPDAKTLVITPWDKSVVKDIEKGIIYANLGFNPIVKGDSLMIVMPSLNEENRKDLVKVVMKKAEEARVTARGIRDQVKAAIKEAEDNKLITEDDFYLFVKELDEYIQEFNNRVRAIAEDKEKEIMKI